MASRVVPPGSLALAPLALRYPGDGLRESPANAPVAPDGQHLVFHDLGEVLDRYLTWTPLALALFRSAEIAHFSKVPLRRPVLDLGCGAGQFAALALQTGIDVGLDISPGQLFQAARTGRYARLEWGDARCLPFADGQYRTVLSLSVLEHVRGPQAVLDETFRILEPGGCFAGTLVLADLHDHLFLPSLSRRLGVPALARLYCGVHDRVFRHVTLLSQAAWEALFSRAGFDLLVTRRVVSPQMTRWFDLLLVTAWPHCLARRFGWSGVWHPRWFRAAVRKLFLRLLETDGTEGSTLLFVARKPPIPAAQRRPQVPSGSLAGTAGPSHE